MGLFRKQSPRDNEGESLIDDIYGRQTEREISEIEQNAERVEAYERMRSRKRRRGFLRVALTFLLMFILTLAVIYIGYRFLFVIKEVKVTGDSPYSAEEVRIGAGIDIGDTLYSFSSVKAEERLRAALPYIYSVNVDRQAPGTIVLDVKCESPVYYTEIYGKIYLISDTLRVLGEAGNTDLTELVWLKLPGVRSVEFGSVPKLCDTDKNEEMSRVTDFVNKSPLKERITRIDLRNPFRLTMVCEEKYLLEFGEYSEIDTKLRIADAVLSDEMFSTSNKAKVDLSDLSETIVVVDNQLEFPLISAND